MMLIVAWLSMLRLTRPVLCWSGGMQLAAYCSAQLAAYSSASDMDIYSGRGKRWDLMMRPDGWRWTKAAPTLFPAFEPSEKRRISLTVGFGLGKTRSGLKFALVGSEGRLSGRENPT